MPEPATEAEADEALPPENLDDAAEPTDASQASYKTGSNYEAAEDEDEAPAGLEDDRPAPRAAGERDLYGEDDELPPAADEELDEEQDVDEDEERDPTGVNRPTGRANDTRIAPVGQKLEEPLAPDDGADSTHAGKPVKLEVISGPDEGKVKQLRGVRMVIGRTAGCDWKISDPSASRRHCELVVGDGGVLLRDLGSGNGTRVNGQKVTEKKLEHGDEISIGKTVFRFIDEVAAFQKAREEAEAKEKAEAEEAAKAEAEAAGAEEASGAEEAEAAEGAEGIADPGAPELTNPTGIPPAALAARSRRGNAWTSLQRSQQIAIVGSLGFFFVLLLVCVTHTAAPPPPPPDPRIARAAEKMQKAKNLIREGKFEEGAKLAEEAEKLRPGTDPDGFVGRAKAEAAAAATLDSARKLADEQRFDEAKAELSRAAFATDSGQQAKAWLAADIDKKSLDWLKAQLDSAIEAKNLDAAKAMVAKLPPAAQRDYSPRLAQLSEDLDKEAAEAAQRDKAMANVRRQKAAEARAEYVNEAFEAVSRKFAAGDFQRAALECDRVVDLHKGDAAIKQRAADLKRLIPQFAKQFEDGQKKYKAGSLETAARPLKKARELYADIGFDGSLGKILDEELGSSALAAANAAFARDDYAMAAAYYRESLHLNPAEDRAKEGLAKLARRAEELYLQAYMIRDREPKEAAAKLRVVVQVADDADPLSRKAKDLLVQLE